MTSSSLLDVCSASLPSCSGASKSTSKSTTISPPSSHGSSSSYSRSSYRWFAYGYSLLAVAMTAGLVFGWQSLRRHLQLRDESLLTESTLGGIFTAGTWTTQACRLVFGMARDRWGCRRVTLISLGCAALGMLGLAWSSPNHAMGLGISLSLVGLGSGVQLCLQPVAALFPEHSGAVMASITGSFQVSALMFLILTKAANFTGLGRNGIFTAYAVLLGFLMVGAVLWVPAASTFVLGLPRTMDGSTDTTNTKETTATDLSLEITAHQRNTTKHNKKNTTEIETTPEEGNDEQVLLFMGDTNYDEMENVDITAVGDQPTSSIAESQHQQATGSPPPSAHIAKDKSTMAWVWESVWELESLQSVPVESQLKHGDQESKKKKGNGLILLLKDHHNISTKVEPQNQAVQVINTSSRTTSLNHEDAMMSGTTTTSSCDQILPTQPQHLLTRGTAPTPVAATAVPSATVAPGLYPARRIANLTLQTTRLVDDEDHTADGADQEVGSSSPTWSVFQQKLDQRLHVLDQQLEANFELLHNRWHDFLDQRQGWAGVTPTTVSLRGKQANHQANTDSEEPPRATLVVAQKLSQDVQATAAATLSPVSNSLSTMASPRTSYWDVVCPPSPAAAAPPVALLSGDSELNLNDETETIFFEPDIIETPLSNPAEQDNHLFPPDFHRSSSCGENDPTSNKDDTIASLKTKINIPSSAILAEYLEWEAPRRNSCTSSLLDDTTTDDYDDILLMVEEEEEADKPNGHQGQQEEFIDLENQQPDELEFLSNMPFEDDEKAKKEQTTADGVPSPSSAQTNRTAWESVWEAKSQASSTTRSRKTSTTKNSGSIIIFEDDATNAEDTQQKQAFTRNQLFPPSFHKQPSDIDSLRMLRSATSMDSVDEEEDEENSFEGDLESQALLPKTETDSHCDPSSQQQPYPRTIAPKLHRMFSDVSHTMTSVNSAAWEAVFNGEVPQQEQAAGVAVEEASRTSRNQTCVSGDHSESIIFEAVGNPQPLFSPTFHTSPAEERAAERAMMDQYGMIEKVSPTPSRLLDTGSEAAASTNKPSFLTSWDSVWEVEESISSGNFDTIYTTTPDNEDTSCRRSRSRRNQRRPFCSRAILTASPPDDDDFPEEVTTTSLTRKSRVLSPKQQKSIKLILPELDSNHDNDDQEPWWWQIWSRHQWSLPAAFHDSRPGVTLSQQMRSAEYILLVVWFSVSVTPLQYYIGSLGFQLEHRAGPEASGFYIDLFSIMYACTAAASPVAGWVADFPQVGLGLSQLIATGLSVVSFVFLTLLDQFSLSTQLIGLAAFCLGRMFVYSTFFAHVGKRFGYRNFGTLTGSGMLLGSIVSLFQLPMIVTASQGPSPARIVNLLSALILLAVAVPFWIVSNRKRRQRQ